MQSSIQMIIEEVKRLSNLYENRVPSVLLFETLFKAEEIHKQEIIKSNRDGVDMVIDKKRFVTGEQYYNETFKKD
jgi:hypothetical protein